MSEKQWCVAVSGNNLKDFNKSIKELEEDDYDAIPDSFRVTSGLNGTTYAVLMGIPFLEDEDEDGEDGNK